MFQYAQAILSPDCRNTLDALLSRADVADKLAAAGKGFREAVKFYLPKLLLGPIYHCFNYFRYIEANMN
jgi:son of sevenless-like protein